MLFLFVAGIRWDSHVSHPEARQQHHSSVCRVVVSECDHHSLRAGVRITPELVLLHIPWVVTSFSLSVSWC